MRLFVVAFGLVLTLRVAHAGLAVQSRVLCGVHTCSDNQYCNSFGNICSDCSNICDLKSHNYEHQQCFDKCQGYIHDQQFASKSESVRLTNSLRDLTVEVKKLQVLAWFSMTFSGVAAVLLLWIGCSKLTSAKRKHGGVVPLLRTKLRSFKKPVKEDLKVESSTGLKLAISAPQNLNDTTPTCSTTLSGTIESRTPPTLTSYKHRSPSEDNVLDYSYDNKAMLGSPASFAKGVEFNSSGEERF
ncbi:uncharacterized protein LOC135945064 [Cloeon dipterum]|uniref:uncharacterized protein LOC135945064 n=1 Tax=Cloeon dipterum TaxID=197152 RepID=UPI00321F7466